MSKRVPPLSAKTVAALKPVAGKTVELIDGAVPGLRCRMSPSGSLSWSLSIRDAEGGRRRFTLGLMGLAEAREKAWETRAMVRDGNDPTAAKRAIRERAAQARDGIGTLDAIVESYFDKGPGAAHRTKTEMQRMIRSVFGAEMKRVAADVRASALLLCADKHPAPASANRAVQYLRPILKWAAKRKLLAAGEDWRDVERPNKETPNQRVLMREELAKLLPVLGETPHGRGLHFMLWTATRLEEVVSATWREFDLDRGLWSLPAERRKGGKVAHVIPLPKQALTYLRSLRVGEDGELKTVADDQPVFVGKQGSQLQNWPRAVKAINAPLGFPAWSPHAMRRTCATLAGEAGVQPHVLSAMLGHAVIGSALLAGYNKSRYSAEHGDALQIVADQLDAIVAGIDNLIPMRRPK